MIAANAEVSAARSVKITALRALADETVNVPTRNYYLLFARELGGKRWHVASDWPVPLVLLEMVEAAFGVVQQS